MVATKGQEMQHLLQQAVPSNVRVITFLRSKGQLLMMGRPSGQTVLDRLITDTDSRSVYVTVPLIDGKISEDLAVWLTHH